MIKKEKSPFLNMWRVLNKKTRENDRKISNKERGSADVKAQ